MKNNQYSKFLLCPHNGCINIPDISYTYEPTHPLIKYKCDIHKNENEGQEELFQFLVKSYHDITCFFCKLSIYNQKNFIYCKQCKNVFDYECLSRHSYFYKDHNIVSVNLNTLYNNCLNHINNTLIFRCINCNESLCGICDLNSHNSLGHELKQLINISINQNEKDKLISDFEKQKYYLNKIKEIYQKIIQTFENDIFLKGKIIENYQNNKYNYQSIKNFNQLKIINNKKYETKLKNIIEEYDNIQNNKNDKESLINQILSPLYYCMMINQNKDYNNSLIDILQNKISNKNNQNDNIHKNDKKNLNNSNNIQNLSINDSKNNINDDIKDNIKNSNNKTKRKKISSEARHKRKKNSDNKNNEKEINSIKESNINIIKEEDPHDEIRTLQIDKSITHMIVLQTGNIAVSSLEGNVYIYNVNSLSLHNEDNCLLQKIIINKNKQVKYIYEFPDITLMCGTYSKIYRIRLINNDTQYNLLGYIEIGQSEIPTKLISLGDSYLVALTEQKKLCNLKIFKNLKINNIKNNYSHNYNNTKQNNFIKDDIKIDEEFEKCFKNSNINEDKKLLCSIFEIIRINNISINNEKIYEFVATSNYVYDLGDNRIEFYELKELENELEIYRVKKIENISCSTEPNSICQLNEQYLCIGLQNFNLKGQISGFAIIDLNERELCQIINDQEIYCLNFIKEKNLLMAAMEVRYKGGNYNMIKIYNIIKNKDKKIEFKKISQFKSKHKDIIVAINELRLMNCAPIAQDNNKNIICISVSKDSSIRVIETHI